MDRRAFIGTVTLGALAAPSLAEAQTAKKVDRIGFLSTDSRGPQEPMLQAFEQALRERGWVTGGNLAIAQRYAEGKYDLLPTLAADLVRLKPQVIVAAGTAAAQAARVATSTIPVVMLFVSDPVGYGLIESSARPGGNVTGLADATVEVSTKRLELLKEVVPNLSRIAILWNPANPTNPLQVKDTDRKSTRLNSSHIQKSRMPSSA